MQKGYKRNGKGMAVLRFFIGLIVIFIILGVIYFFLSKVDYSDKIAEPNVAMRSYVEMTASPDAGDGDDSLNSSLSVIGGADGPTAILVADATDDWFVDLTVTATPEPTPVPTPTPTVEPTPVPTPTPEPTPTPTPTPEPTKIASKALSALRKSGFKVPEPTTGAEAAVTNVYISEPNDNKYVQVQGYGYIDEESFDASKCTIFLIVTNRETGRQIAYKGASRAGASGVDHAGAKCQNVEKADFDVILSVNQYDDGYYDLGLVLYYRDSAGKKAYSYHELGESIAVKDKAAVTGNADNLFADPVLDEDGNEVPALFVSDGDGTDPMAAAAEAEAETEAEPVGEEAPTTDVFGAPLTGNAIG